MTLGNLLSFFNLTVREHLLCQAERENIKTAAPTNYQGPTTCSLDLNLD